MLPAATGRDREITRTTLEQSGAYALVEARRPSTGAAWFYVRKYDGAGVPFTVGGKVYADVAAARSALIVFAEAK